MPSEPLLTKDAINIGGHKFPIALVGGIAAVAMVILVLRARKSGSNVVSAGQAPYTAASTGFGAQGFSPDYSAALADLNQQLTGISQQLAVSGSMAPPAGAAAPAASATPPGQQPFGPGLGLSGPSSSASGQAVTVWGGQLQDFQVTNTGELLQRWFDPSVGRWGAADLGGGFQPGSTPLLSDAFGQLQVFAPLAGGGIGHEWYQPGAGWGRDTPPAPH